MPIDQKIAVVLKVIRGIVNIGQFQRVILKHRSGQAFYMVVLTIFILTMVLTLLGDYIRLRDNYVTAMIGLLFSFFGLLFAIAVIHVFRRPD